MNIKIAPKHPVVSDLPTHSQKYAVTKGNCTWILQKPLIVMAPFVLTLKDTHRHTSLQTKKTALPTKASKDKQNYGQESEFDKARKKGESLWLHG